MQAKNAPRIFSLQFFFRQNLRDPKPATVYFRELSESRRKFDNTNPPEARSQERDQYIEGERGRRPMKYHKRRQSIIWELVALNTVPSRTTIHHMTQ